MKYDYYKEGFTPYEIIRAYKHIVDPAHQHALKKLIRLGTNTKSELQDLMEVIDSLNEYKKHLESNDVEPSTFSEKCMPKK